MKTVAFCILHSANFCSRLHGTYKAALLKEVESSVPVREKSVLLASDQPRRSGSPRTERTGTGIKNRVVVTAVVIFMFHLEVDFHRTLEERADN